MRSESETGRVEKVFVFENERTHAMHLKPIIKITGFFSFCLAVFAGNHLSLIAFPKNREGFFVSNATP
jgi:hypothetical protein